ncbi:SDR family NAD(P)-dependent oxidoreductase [Testudinibacter sp. TR-2022]|uniref:SDR family NAD(P)-dependent oxidoreductase n=1 Tax=Testudinibacter sp. TR-2022 TaxID=2585029 RepID=UPI00111B7BAD|nr:SDR family NAD(P)-dependent oxidoreductase [Testudinibacter sp. TR-2022]TNH09369.1 SDR family NAD(P)-dependent oxidoreductase [Pasteurellaceae bacterium Phil11]TNH25059.1 SDR family NAD(P)-dependent oxidoreductase [Testudinibacter sp. TR-2022]TNH29395.1 SDR family NAD(P)-dependent oxidoreductase [Testudinibacter sp. TR-2022]
MTQKVWLITGASRGFGNIWAKAALARGDKVAATARKIGALDDLKQAYGEAFLPLALDVTDREAVFAAVNQAQQHFGRLDVVLSNAGFGYMAAVEEAEMADVRATFETNVFGTLSVIQAALPIMRAQGGGHILAVSSVAGLVAMPTSGIYEAAKFAVEGMAEALAAEVAQFGIHVTIIEPGGYATDFLSGSSMKTAPALAAYDPLRAELAAMLTADQLGVPEASAPAILQVVDAPNPPLRLILGDLLPLVKEVYAKRIETWEAWDDVSRAALGK